MSNSIISKLEYHDHGFLDAKLQTPKMHSLSRENVKTMQKNCEEIIKLESVSTLLELCKKNAEYAEHAKYAAKHARISTSKFFSLFHTETNDGL